MESSQKGYNSFPCSSALVWYLHLVRVLDKKMHDQAQDFGMTSSLPLLQYVVPAKKVSS